MKVFIMENHEGDTASDELIKSLGGATIIDEHKEGNSELVSLGEVSGDEPTQVEIQERKCTLLNVHGKKCEDEEGNKKHDYIKINENCLQSQTSNVKETNICDNKLVGESNEKGKENKGINSNQSLTSSDDIAFDKIKTTPIKIEYEEKSNDFETDNFLIFEKLSSVDAANFKDLNESCVHNKCGEMASKNYANPASNKNVYGDKSDDMTLKLEGASEVSQTESGSISNITVKPNPSSDILQKNVCDDKTDYSTLKLEEDASKSESGSNIIDEYKRFNGHMFDKDHVLRDKNGKKFNFNIYENHYQNQKRYEEIGKDIDNYVYELLEMRCKMIRHCTPFDATSDEPQGFFFASENAEKTEDKLLLLIHGSGVVRAGQWARRIIINDNLMDGSQIPYIEQAYNYGYEVVVLNTNQNEINHHPIRGNEGAEQHALYVWDNFIMKRVKAKHIAVMAHSYGGVVTVSLAKQQSFRERVFAIGFSDSVHTFGMNAKREVKDFFKKCARNWVASEEALDTPFRKSTFSTDCIDRFSAGHEQHEWTSTTCMKSVFKFFEKKFKETKEGEGSEVDETNKCFPNKIRTTATSDVDLGQQSEIHDCQSGASFSPSEISGQTEGSGTELSDTLVDSAYKYQLAD